LKDEAFSCVKIEEYTRLPQNAKVVVKFRGDSPLLSGEETYGEAWLEVYEIITAQPIAYATWRWIKLKPVITMNSYGKGKVIMIGTVIPIDILTKMLKELIQSINLKPAIYEVIHDSNVEYYTRSIDLKKKTLFIINHEGIPKQLKIKPSEYAAHIIELLTNKEVKPIEIELTLDPHDVKILLIE
jgi:hypothetical protein